MTASPAVAAQISIERIKAVMAARLMDLLRLTVIVPPPLPYVGSPVPGAGRPVDHTIAMTAWLARLDVDGESFSELRSALGPRDHHCLVSWEGTDPVP